MSRAPAANTVIAVSVVAAAAAGCTTPRDTALVVVPAPASPSPMPARSDSIVVPPAPASPSPMPTSPHRSMFVNGTVTTTFAPGAPVIVAGDQRIKPDEDTRRAIEIAGLEEVTGSLELCSNADGAPFKITMTRSTEYATYDQQFTDGARRWRFIPHQFRGEYVSSCTSVQFTYRPWRN